jgi:hypothetical protein
VPRDVRLERRGATARTCSRRALRAGPGPAVTRAAAGRVRRGRVGTGRACCPSGGAGWTGTAWRAGRRRWRSAAASGMLTPCGRPGPAAAPLWPGPAAAPLWSRESRRGTVARTGYGYGAPVPRGGDWACCACTHAVGPGPAGPLVRLDVVRLGKAPVAASGGQWWWQHQWWQHQATRCPLPAWQRLTHHPTRRRCAAGPRRPSPVGPACVGPVYRRRSRGSARLSPAAGARPGPVSAGIPAPGGPAGPG